MTSNGLKKRKNFKIRRKIKKLPKSGRSSLMHMGLSVFLIYLEVEKLLMHMGLFVIDIPGRGALSLGQGLAWSGDPVRLPDLLDNGGTQRHQDEPPTLLAGPKRPADRHRTAGAGKTDQAAANHARRAGDDRRACARRGSRDGPERCVVCD